MIRRKTRFVLLGKVLLAGLAAAVVVLFALAPTASAANDPGGVSQNLNALDNAINKADAQISPQKQNDAVNANAANQCVAKDKDKNAYECNGESDIAKQCDDQRKVDPEWTDQWYALTAAVNGCGVIMALDWTMSKLGGAFDTTTVDLQHNSTAGMKLGGSNVAPSSSTSSLPWFRTEYGYVKTIAIWTIPPIFLIAIMHAMLSGKFDKLLKISLAYFPVSILGTAVAITIVQQLIYITDDICQAFQRSINADVYGFTTNIARGFGPDGFVVNGGGKMWFISLMLGLGLLLATCVMYIILSMREASIYIAALFLPIVFAMLIWPPLQKWFKKLVEFLVGMIISKIIMVAAISLMVASFTASIGGHASAAANALTPQGDAGVTVPGDQNRQSDFSWFAQTVTMIFTFFVVCFAPNIPSKLFANVGFDDTGKQQAMMQNRPDLKRKIDWANRMVGVATAAVQLKNNLQQYPSARAYGDAVDPVTRNRELIGLSARPAAYNEEQRATRGYGKAPTPPAGRNNSEHELMVEIGDQMIKEWSATQNQSKNYVADLLMGIGADNLVGINVVSGSSDENVASARDVLANAKAGDIINISRVVTDKWGNQSIAVESVELLHDDAGNQVKAASAAAMETNLKEQNSVDAVTGRNRSRNAIHLVQEDQDPNQIPYGNTDKTMNAARQSTAKHENMAKKYNNSGKKVYVAKSRGRKATGYTAEEHLPMFRE